MWIRRGSLHVKTRLLEGYGPEDSSVFTAGPVNQLFHLLASRSDRESILHGQFRIDFITWVILSRRSCLGTFY